jgi:tetratricopeptide (TPR) repeat protein
LIVPLFLLAAAVAAPESKCPDVVTSDAMVCRALEAQAGNDYAGAAAAFERAAEAAAVNGDSPELAHLLAAAGNMWIAAAEPGKAAFVLDKAIASPSLIAEQRGEALLDRARAAEAQGDLKTARARVNEAMGTVAADPFAWYFSAALSIREGNPKEAERMINKALALAPADPAILFEAGHVAEANDDVVGARDYWGRTIERDPNGAFGRAAREALNLLPAPLTVTDRVADPSQQEPDEPEVAQPKS